VYLCSRSNVPASGSRLAARRPAGAATPSSLLLPPLPPSPPSPLPPLSPSRTPCGAPEAERPRAQTPPARRPRGARLGVASGGRGAVARAGPGQGLGAEGQGPGRRRLPPGCPASQSTRGLSEAARPVARPPPPKRARPAGEGRDRCRRRPPRRSGIARHGRPPFTRPATESGSSASAPKGRCGRRRSTASSAEPGSRTASARGRSGRGRRVRSGQVAHDAQGLAPTAPVRTQARGRGRGRQSGAHPVSGRDVGRLRRCALSPPLRTCSCRAEAPTRQDRSPGPPSRGAMGQDARPCKTGEHRGGF
jgi:hypothetical protein